MTKQRITIDLEYDRSDAVHWVLHDETGKVIRSSRTSDDRLPFATGGAALMRAAKVVDQSVRLALQPDNTEPKETSK